RQSPALDAVFVHVARVVVSNLLRNTTVGRVSCGGVLNETAHPLPRALGQHYTCVIGLSAGRDRDPGHPAAICIAVEIVARLDQGVSIAVVGTWNDRVTSN